MGQLADQLAALAERVRTRVHNPAESSDPTTDQDPKLRPARTNFASNGFAGPDGGSAGVAGGAVELAVVARGSAHFR
ncbi:MAG: hypothetical protein M3Y48_15445 [Actinomycetota bacterium]|nr:hypothetical protein [Actinomycetota bacterium]